MNGDKTFDSICSYIECMDCGETLTEIKPLKKNYLEYSFSRFLKTFLLNDIEISIFKHFESLKCKHFYKSRVFKYDHILVKFHSSKLQYYSIYNLNFKDYEIKEYKRKLDEKFLHIKMEDFKHKFKNCSTGLQNIIQSFLNLENDEGINKKKKIVPDLKENLENLIKDLSDYNESIVEEIEKKNKKLGCLEIDYLRLQSYSKFKEICEVLNKLLPKIDKKTTFYTKVLQF